MSDLTNICSDLGFQGPRTLLASGNVVFSAEGAPASIEILLEAALARFGLETDVLVRDDTELQKLIAANPFQCAAQDHPSHVLVTFHRQPFPAEALQRLRAMHDGPEQLVTVDRELFVDYGGREQMRASTLPASMRKARFPTIATARNWNTVMKLGQALLPSPI